LQTQGNGGISSTTIDSALHRFACGVILGENRNCADGGLYNYVEVLWCDESDNFLRTSITSSLFKAEKYEHGKPYRKQTMLCKPGYLIDGVYMSKGYTKNNEDMAYCGN
jgi:hypothetical protein